MAGSGISGNEGGIHMPVQHLPHAADDVHAVNAITEVVIAQHKIDGRVILPRGGKCFINCAGRDNIVSKQVEQQGRGAQNVMVVGEGALGWRRIRNANACARRMIAASPSWSSLPWIDEWNACRFNISGVAGDQGEAVVDCRGCNQRIYYRKPPTSG